MALPSYRPGGLPEPDTTFSSPSYTRAEYALDQLHEASKNYRPRNVPAPAAARPIEQAAPAIGGQPEHRQPERRDQDEPGLAEPEAADEPDEPRPVRATTGPVFAGRDIAENMTSLATEL